jgi:Na+-transporting NADH:ubiquinone oxidoreductase subunit A
MRLDVPKLRFHLHRGLDIPLAGPPRPEIHAAPPVQSVALLTGDYPSIKPVLLVEEGSRVRLGEPLMQDRGDPRLRLVSPGTGVVKTIHRGAKRALRSVVVQLEGDDELSFEPVPAASLPDLSPEAVRERLLESGLWTAIRARPYGRIALPDTEPHALFVTAIDTEPLAPDPRIMIGEYGRDFADGVAALARLVSGDVFVCCGPGPEMKLPDDPRIQVAEFSGPHPAGLPGTHIHFIAPVSAKRSAWYVGYQDVIAIGRLFTTGRISTERVISLAGPAVLEPRLLRTRLGASTEDLVEGQLGGGECRVISGSALSGREAHAWSDFLGRYHNQVTVLAEGREREFLVWTLPGRDKFSLTRTFLSGFLPDRLFPLDTNQRGSPRAMVPIGSFERVMPLDILPTQLLRAIAVGDTDAAQELGCLELDEEDLALCSFVCPSKYDYGPLLRQALTRIEKEG